MKLEHSNKLKCKFCQKEFESGEAILKHATESLCMNKYIPKGRVSKGSRISWSFVENALILIVACQQLYDVLSIVHLLKIAW